VYTIYIDNNLQVEDARVYIGKEFESRKSAPNPIILSPRGYILPHLYNGEER
jgi:hypothetical protein